MTADMKVVKSAGRALAILEYFTEARRPASATDIRAYLGLPASSATALLRSLVELGYLHYRSQDRTYVPTVRTGLLGDWQPHSFTGNHDLQGLLDRLGETTKQLVVLGTRCKSHAQYIYVVRCSEQLRHVKRGTIAPLTRTAVGWTLLSRLPDPEIRRLCTRGNAEVTERDRIPLSWLLENIQQVRESGYAFCFGHVTPDVGAIAMSLPVPPDQPPLVVAVSGSGSGFVRRKDDLVDAMKTRIDQYVRTISNPAGHSVALMPASDTILP